MSFPLSQDLNHRNIYLLSPAQIRRGRSYATSPYWPISSLFLWHVNTLQQVTKFLGSADLHVDVWKPLSLPQQTCRCDLILFKVIVLEYLFLSSFLCLFFLRENLFLLLKSSICGSHFAMCHYNFTSKWYNSVSHLKSIIEIFKVSITNTRNIKAPLLSTNLPLILPGELGFELLLALLTVSIREDLDWDCLPADERGLLTAPRTLAALGWNQKYISFILN